jgi:hypothetical protein
LKFNALNHDDKKHDKKKKNAMSGSEELVNVVRQLILIIDRINKNIGSLYG